MLRRIAALEKRLGARLFERMPSGYALTPLGEELVEAARGVDEAVGRIELKLAGADLKVSGPVRVTTTDTLVVSLLPEIFGELEARASRHRVELTTSNLFLNLTRREADVAIRPADDPPDVLFGRRITAIGFAVYGKRAAAARTELPPADLARRAMDRPGRQPFGDGGSTLDRNRPCPTREIAARADSFVTMAALAEAGLGLAALPCYLGDRSATLMRMSQPIEAMRTSLWLLTHEQLRRTARIRTFMEFVGAALRRRKAIEGQQGRLAPVIKAQEW